MIKSYLFKPVNLCLYFFCSVELSKLVVTIASWPDLLDPIPARLSKVFPFIITFGMQSIYPHQHALCLRLYKLLLIQPVLKKADSDLKLLDNKDMYPIFVLCLKYFEKNVAYQLIED